MGPEITQAPSDATEAMNYYINCRKDADDQQPCTGCINAPDSTGGELITTWFSSLQCQIENEPTDSHSSRSALQIAAATKGVLRDKSVSLDIMICCDNELSLISKLGEHQ